MQRHVVRTLTIRFPFLQPGWQKEKTPGGFIIYASAGGNGPPTGRKRRLIRGVGGGGLPLGSGITFGPRDPGGGAVSNDN